jgi:methylenetetrahydrofolate reductase (NADPH)
MRSASHLRVSFEVFPPKTDDGLVQLADTAHRLSAADPTFVSVTYGAGGTSRDRSFAAIDAVLASGVEVAAHLTCVGQSVDDVHAVVERYGQLGVSQIVALRGDPATGIDAPYAPHPDGFHRTSDLVASVAGRFEVSVSAYPERHPQSPSLAHDLDVLAGKVAAGATRAMTQMFFDNAHFVAYRDAVAGRRIDVALVPGIFPIHSFPAVARFASRCGASMPAWVAERFAGLDDDPATTHAVAADLAAEQIAELAAEGVGHVHVYTLNRPELALAVCERLGLVEPEFAS